MIISARDLLLKNKRFDLIYKYLFCEKYINKSKFEEIEFYKDLYLKSIFHFNKFNEVEPQKVSKEEFTSSYLKLIKSFLENGFLEEGNSIPVTQDLQLINGAHRTAVAACLDLKVHIHLENKKTDFDYRLFMHNNMDIDLLDYGALEYFEIINDLYVINLHSIVPVSMDSKVEKILENFGHIYYKKNVNLDFNGYINLKKVSYKHDITGNINSWIGDSSNDFAGAKEHAFRSYKDNSPLRVYLFYSDSIEKVMLAKEKIREFLNLGNFSIHSSDNKLDGKILCENLLNNRSVNLLNKRPYNQETLDFDNKLNLLKDSLYSNSIAKRFCLGGSSPLSCYGLRQAGDIDLLHMDDFDDFSHINDITSHNLQKKYYHTEIHKIILNPKNYFYYNGLKVISLKVLAYFKKNRNEIPKDLEDIKLIEGVESTKILAYKESPLSCEKYFLGLFKKERFLSRRIIYFVNIKIYTYSK